MQVCTSLQTDNHASTPPLSVLQAGCPSCRPTNSVKTLKAHRWTWKLVVIVTPLTPLYPPRPVYESSFCTWKEVYEASHGRLTGSYSIAITQSFNKCTNVTHVVTFAAGSMLMAKLQQPFNHYGISWQNGLVAVSWSLTVIIFLWQKMTEIAYVLRWWFSDVYPTTWLQDKNVCESFNYAYLQYKCSFYIHSGYPELHIHSQEKAFIAAEERVKWLNSLTPHLRTQQTLQ